jgi:hypothetical protein
VADEKYRPHWVAAPGFFKLNHACALINKAFDKGGFGCYLVGSALERRDHRDVDVRFIMDDAQYDRMFRDQNEWLNPLWSLLCISISTWLREMTGLPVDFQIQRQTQANEVHGRGAGKKRNALGIFLDYPGERPGDLGVDEPATPAAPETGGTR